MEIKKRECRLVLKLNDLFFTHKKYKLTFSICKRVYSYFVI